MNGRAPIARQAARCLSLSYPLSAKTSRIRFITPVAAGSSRWNRRVSLTFAAVTAQAAGLPGAGAQTPPGRAFAKEPAQRGKHPHRLAAWVTRAGLRRHFTARDDLGQQVQQPEIQPILHIRTSRYGEGDATPSQISFNRR